MAYAIVRTDLMQGTSDPDRSGFLFQQHSEENSNGSKQSKVYHPEH